MKTISQLADNEHPLVRETVKKLTHGKKSVQGKLEKLFIYVRDGILFGFPIQGDLIKASETIQLGMGQCNTKGALFLALCKASGIPSRIHFSLIKKEIQRGLFTGIGYRLLPPLLSHSWVDVKIGRRWCRIDSFINDMPFYEAGKQALRAKGWDTGYSISCTGGTSSADFNIENEAFVQMDAVVKDHGVWKDPADYYQSGQYRNRPNPVSLLFYRFLIKRVNARVGKMRSGFQMEGGSSWR